MLRLGGLRRQSRPAGRPGTLVLFLGGRPGRRRPPRAERRREPSRRRRTSPTSAVIAAAWIPELLIPGCAASSRRASPLRSIVAIVEAGQQKELRHQVRTGGNRVRAPVGAENRVTGYDLGRCHVIDLPFRPRSRRRLGTIGTRGPTPGISRCDPDLRLAGAARPVAGVQGRRDPRAAPATVGTGAHRQTPCGIVGRTGSGRRAGTAAAQTAATGPADHPADPAALAPRPDHPQMGSAQHARTTIQAGRVAGVDREDGQGEQRLGVPAYPRRTRRPRLQAGTLDGLADPEERRDRPRPTPREPR
ncbi:MAG: hypothetical protein JWN00_1950 [Actinomycetia bacterium]|nr:hypothetical protein [Actinomycetes bacterium]